MTQKIPQETPIETCLYQFVSKNCFTLGTLETALSGYSRMDFMIAKVVIFSDFFS